MRRAFRTWAWGLAMFSILQFVHGVERSSAEVSGPFAAAAVDSTLAHYTPQTQVSGTFKVQGSETMYPLMSRLSLEFQRRQPKVVIQVRGGIHEGHCGLLTASS